MKKDSETVEAYEGEDYTKITFKPDFRRFMMTGLEDDTMRLFKKRVSRVLTARFTT